MSEGTLKRLKQEIITFSIAMFCSEGTMVLILPFADIKPPEYETNS